MRETLYHYLMGWPMGVSIENLTKGTLKADYAPHALAEASFDRFGAIACPDTFDLTKCKVIELAMDPEWPNRDHKRRITKVVYRTPLDAKRDLVFVVRWGRNDRPCIVTVWSNLKTDQHATLRRDKYRAGKVSSGIT